MPSATHLSQALLSTLHASRQVFCVVLACISCVNSRPLVDEDSTKEARPSVHASDKSPREGTLAAHESTNSGGKVQRECAAQMIKMDARDGTEALGKDHGGGWLPRQTSLAIDVASGQAFAVQFEGAGRGPGWEVSSYAVISLCSISSCLLRITCPTPRCSLRLRLAGSKLEPPHDRDGHHLRSNTHTGQDQINLSYSTIMNPPPLVTLCEAGATTCSSCHVLASIYCVLL